MVTRPGMRWLNDAVGQAQLLAVASLRHLSPAPSAPSPQRHPHGSAGRPRKLLRHRRAMAGPEPPMRLILVANQTLAGRLVFGPILAVAGFWRDGVPPDRCRRPSASGDLARAHRLDGAAADLGHGRVRHAVMAISRCCSCFPGTALTMLRSYMEHRPAKEPGARCAVVEDAGAFGFLFLHNNLHAVHHRWPGWPGTGCRRSTGAPRRDPGLERRLSDFGL